MDVSAEHNTESGAGTHDDSGCNERSDIDMQNELKAAD
jgi:hypothetical protein